MKDESAINTIKESIHVNPDPRASDLWEYYYTRGHGLFGPRNGAETYNFQANRIFTITPQSLPPLERLGSCLRYIADDVASVAGHLPLKELVWEEECRERYKLNSSSLPEGREVYCNIIACKNDGYRVAIQVHDDCNSWSDNRYISQTARNQSEFVIGGAADPGEAHALADKAMRDVLGSYRSSKWDKDTEAKTYRLRLNPTSFSFSSHKCAVNGVKVYEGIWGEDIVLPEENQTEIVITSHLVNGREVQSVRLIVADGFAVNGGKYASMILAALYEAISPSPSTTPPSLPQGLQASNPFARSRLQFGSQSYPG